MLSSQTMDGVGPMKNLLIATDLSARSDRALDRAVALARDSGGELTVVHVVDEGLPGPLADVQVEQARKIIRQHIDPLSGGNGRSINIEVVVGRTLVNILDICEKNKADLIVMGEHRQDVFRDMFRGTIAERIVRAGDLPVLLVKDRAISSYRRIIVGIDFSVFSKRALEFAIKNFPSAELYLIHAYSVFFKSFLYEGSTRRDLIDDKKRKFKKMLDEEMADFFARFQTRTPKIEAHLQEGPVCEVLHHQKNLLDADLLIVGTHGRTGVAHTFLGSVSEDLLGNPPCDVLAVKAW